MSWPLQDSDPRQVGAFRLRGRLEESSVGVVYLAADASGDEVSVAMLSRGAAGDSAARDRFGAAVERGAGVAGAPEVLAANARGSVPWVAARAVSGEGHAGAFFKPVDVGAGGSGGPVYAPYWAGAHAPSGSWWGWLPRLRGGAVADPNSNRAVIAGLLMLLVLLAVLAVLAYLLLADVREEAAASGAPSPSVSASPSPSPQPSPSASASPSPSPGESGQPSQAPSPSGSPGSSSPVPDVPVPESALPESGEGVDDLA